MKNILAALILTFTFLFVGSSAANAATLTVTKIADTNDNVCNADCSLREAILAAASGDVIEFASPLFNTPQAIRLTLGQLTVPSNKTLMINGRGANLTYISAGNLSRVIENQGSLTLNGLTIQDGRASLVGGGIYNRAILSLYGSVIFGNTSDNYGGGVYNEGIMEIFGSTIFGNTTFSPSVSDSHGGGIYNAGRLVIESSTISDNISYGNGNSEGSGIYHRGDQLTIISSTITANRGRGLYKTNVPLRLANTIISGNFGGNFGGNISLNLNINNFINGDAQLAFLADNGGTVPTHIPLPGSPVINAGSGCVLTVNGCGTSHSALTTDQRGAGFQRRNSGAVDIGAIESPPVVYNAENSGAGSLSATIADAAAGAAINFYAPFFNEPRTIPVTGGEIIINKNLTINGPGANLVTIDAANQSRIFSVLGGVTLTVSGVKITRGYSVNNGGCVANAGVFNFVDGEVSDCAGFNGAGLYNTGGTLNVVRSIVKNSSAPNGGGGIFSDGLFFLTDSVVENNNASSGGGIYINQTANITRSVIRSNTATNACGGIFSDGTFNFTDSTISGNTATGLGGGFCNQGFSSFFNSTLSGNRTTGNKGAGIYNFSGKVVHLLNTTITNNRADAFAGAGIWNENFSSPPITVRARNTIIAGNISGNGAPFDYVGNLTDLGNNLVNNNNPGLAPLGNYGGATPTHALLPNSPALNAGSDCALTANTCGVAHSAFPNDQRGSSAPRKIGASVDIGSSERSITIDPTTLPNGSNGTPYSQTLTATRAASFAKNLLTGEKIDFFNVNSSLAPFAFSIVPAAGESLPPGLTLAANGTLSGTPTEAGIFTFTVKASDADAIAGAARFTITISAANTPPMISGATVQRQAGSAVSNSTIATVNDAESGSNGVSVSVASTNPSGGVTVSNIVNTNGNVTADVIAVCSATNSAFTLTASDGSLQTNGTLTVNVSANTAPVLQYPATVSLTSGNSVNVLPTAASDNGSMTYSILSVSPALPTTPTIDANGGVSVVNGGSTGNYQITVRATDNCGLTTDTGFTLVVTNARTVTKTADSNDGACDTDCSLREAIAAANNGDLIQFAAPLFDSPQTILLAESLQSLVINKSLTISGKGANLLTVGRASNSSIRFRVFTLNAQNISISGMTVSGGDATDGGGVKIDGGTVVLRGMVVESNTARADGGGIYVNDGATLIFDSGTVRGNAIFTSGIDDGNGGGILARPQTTTVITNSQIYGNLVEDERSSNFSPLGGGGGVESGGTLTLLNSLIFQNSVLARYSNPNQSQEVTGGGLFFRSSGNLNMKNSVIADNFSGISIIETNTTTPDGAQDIYGFLTNSGGNLVKDRGFNSFGYVASDLPHGTLPMIVLGNNGGSVQTYAPVAGSPLIDSGESCVGTANGCGFTHPAIGRDIRGALRPFDGDNNGSVMFDIGAVESGSTPLGNVPFTDFINRYGFDFVAPGSTVRFNVIFSQNVTGVDASDFALTTTGNLSGAGVTEVSGGGSSYLVSVNVGSGTQGTVRLDLSDNDSIRNSSDLPLGGAGAGNANFTTGEFFTVTDQEIDVTAPQDTLQIVDGFYPGGSPPENEGVGRSIDNTTGKYLNFTKDGAGFIVTPQRGATVLSAVRFYTANDSPERDPAYFRLEGSNGNGVWTLIAEQYLSLPLERNATGQMLTASGLHSQTVQLPTNLIPAAYRSYRVTFPLLRETFANAMQIGEVELIGRAFVAPTAANVTVSGRVLAAEGGGLRNARVVLADSNGNSRSVLTGSFGYYRFENVPVGEIYTVSVQSKRFTFEPQIILVMDNISDLDFTVNE